MKDIKGMAASLGRSFLAAVLAMYMAGITEPKTLSLGGVEAVAPVLLRVLNPKDAAFGLQGK